MSLLWPFSEDLGWTLRPSTSIFRRRPERERRRRRRRTPWRRLMSLDDDVWDMGDQLDTLQEEVSSMLEDFGFPTTTTTTMAPALEFRQPGTRPRRTSEREALTSLAPIEETQEQDKYVVNIPLGDIPAENLKISCKDRVMSIEAKKEEKSDDGSARLYQEYTRKFTLPENVQANAVKSTLTPEGILRIEAPMPQPQLEAPKEPRAIPIQVEGVPQQVK